MTTATPLDPAGVARRTHSVDELVAATQQDRDRVVDLVRGLSIVVVVLWHWTFSVTRWSGGSLSMPNPIGEASGLWLLTWIFQVMPLFFVVGGFSNLAGWTSTRSDHSAGAPRPFVASNCWMSRRRRGGSSGRSG